MGQRTRCAVAALARLVAGSVVAASFTCGSIIVGTSVIGSAPTAGAATLRSSACAARSVSGPAELKLDIRDTPAGKLPTVSVCVDGRGPFTFLVSTGAGSSVITPSLAHLLGLHEGSTRAVRGVTCVAAAPSVEVKSWSVAGVKLAAQRLLVAQVAKAGSSPSLSGVIGSDVLSRFGAVRIDYKTSRLVLLGKELAGPRGNVYVLGARSAAPPLALGKSTIKVSAVLRVLESPEGTIVAAPVKIAGRTEQLSVDSGSAGSGLVPTVARSLKLKASAAKVAFSGLGCTGTTPAYASGVWLLGGSPLPGSLLAAHAISGSLNSGLQGILGSNVLAADGSVIVDYKGAHLWLTSG